MSTRFRIMAAVAMAISAGPGRAVPSEPPHPATVSQQQAADRVHAPKRGDPSSVDKIEKALDRQGTIAFRKVLLRDVVQSLAADYHVNLLLDRKALDEVGIGDNTPMTFSISGVSLRSALGLMLRALDLTWTIRDEVLLVTTPEQTEWWMVTKVYDVADLVTCRDEKSRLWADHDSLVEVIERCVVPKSWSGSGGPASISGMLAGGGEVLVVRQTWQNHDKIARLLEKLREIARKSPGYGKPPLRSRRPARPRPKKKPVQGGMGGGFF